METEKKQDVLLRTVMETLEEAAFIFTEPTEGTPPEWTEDTVLHAELPFGGDSAGTLMIASSSEPTVELAANLLGIEPSDEDAQEKRADALGEILNIIGGIVVEEWFGTEADVQLGVPEVRAVDVAEYERKVTNSECCFSLITEEGLRIDGGASTAS